jgi:5-methyltetrahydrofolate--homocysteine methyltransferase
VIEQPGQATSEVSAEEAAMGRPSGTRPLLMSADAAGSLRARGVRLDPNAPLGRLVREDPDAVRELYEAQVEAGVDVLCALTCATAPRSLAPIGMGFRAAALTGVAVDLAIEAAAAVSRRIGVAGVLGHFPASVTSAEADRVAEDYATHATRLAAAGCEILVACGFQPEGSVPPGLARLARRAAVVSASATQLATWALIELQGGLRTADGESVEDAARAALDGGADTLLFQVDAMELGVGVLGRLERVREDGQIGFLLTEPGAIGAPGHAEPPCASIDVWVASAMRLIDAGARVLGGGTGTTVGHVAALAKVLREARRVPAWRRSL